MADLLTPVSAFLKIAEHSDYAFLLESVEGGEQVARYSFLGKDPFLILRARDGRTMIERDGESAASETPFLDVLRSTDGGLPLAATSRGCRASPAGPSGTSATTRCRGSSPCRCRPGPRATPTPTTPGSWCSTRCWRSITCSTASCSWPTRASGPTTTCTRSTSSRARRSRSSKRELERSLSLGSGPAAGPAEVRSNLTREAVRGARHGREVRDRRRRDLPGGALAAFRDAALGRPVHGVPGAAAREPLALHVLHPDGRHLDRRRVAGDAGARGGDGGSRRIPSPARARAARAPRRTCAWPTS